MARVTLKSHLLILFATALIAGSFISSAALSPILNPFSLTLMRFLCSALILLPFVLIKNSYRQAILSTLPRALVISLFFSLFFICFFESLHTTSALNTGALYTCVPLLTAVLSFVAFKQRIGLRRLAVYLVGAAGACSIIFKGELDLFLSFSLNKGDLLFLLGSFFLCCYSISMKLLFKNDRMIVLVFCILAGGSLWMSLALLILGLPLEWDALHGTAIYHMAYLILGATLFTVYLYQKTTVDLGPNKVMAYIYLNPAFVAVLLYLVNGETIDMKLIPGIIITSIATILLQRETS